MTEMTETLGRNEAAMGQMTETLDQLAATSAAERPPVVVETFPETGAAAVDPAITEIRVTYSEPMMDGNWSWTQVSEDTFPEMTGEPRYLEDGKTCVVPVKLQPGKTYATWLNIETYKNFKDVSGRPAVPYFLQFTTRP